MSRLLWSNEDLELLRKLASERHSASQMTVHFPGRTRDSVIGVCKRNDIRLLATSTATDRIKVIKPRVRIHLLPKEPEKIDLIDPGNVHSVRIDGLRYGLCRWPLWGHNEESLDERFYCGASTDKGCVYCPWHRKISRRELNQSRLGKV